MAKVISMQAPTPSRTAWLGMLFRGLLIALAGAFIVFYTDNFIRVLTVGVGGWLVVSGITTLIGAFRINDDKARRNYTLLRSILNIVIGAIAIWMPFAVAATYWVVLLFVVALQLCIGAVLEIMIGLRLRSAGLPASGAFFGAVISIAIAVILFLAPEFIGELLVQLIGWLILALGILMMAYSFRFRFRKQPAFN